MRLFLIILSTMARCFLLLEKSLTNGHRDAIIQELQEVKSSLNKLSDDLKTKGSANV